jgi:hypothetical protein
MLLPNAPLPCLHLRPAVVVLEAVSDATWTRRSAGDGGASKG